MVLGHLSFAVGRPFYVIASWHLFIQNAVQTFLLPRLGVFSIYREGSDREALKTAMPLTAEAERPLVIFPEGVMPRHNDKLNNLMEGTELMARGAAQQRADANPPGKVVVHPLAIRYFLTAMCAPRSCRCGAISSTRCRGARTDTSPSRTASPRSAARS